MAKNLGPGGARQGRDLGERRGRRPGRAPGGDGPGSAPGSSAPAPPAAACVALAGLAVTSHGAESGEAVEDAAIHQAVRCARAPAARPS